MRFELVLAIVMIVAISVVLVAIVKSEPVAGVSTAIKANSTAIVSMDENKFPKAPELVGITGYINTTPDKLEQEMKGKVILYDFWTFNCINCIHTIPYVTALDAKYGDRGLLIIGIHSPETAFEKDPANVQNAVQRFGIKYPVVLDNNYNTWTAFGNIYWPRQYLVDANGHIRYNHIGEGNYDEIENEVRSLLAERNQTT
jgi:thiol-disulfide isomerase/thioredoxin